MRKPIINKVDKKGRYLCARCGGEILVGFIVNHRIHCQKCRDIIKGERNENGVLTKGVAQ